MKPNYYARIQYLEKIVDDCIVPMRVGEDGTNEVLQLRCALALVGSSIAIENAKKSEKDSEDRCLGFALAIVDSLANSTVDDVVEKIRATDWTKNECITIHVHLLDYEVPIEVIQDK